MNREIIRLALPNILTNLTVPVLGMVDLFLMGHLNASLFMGAVALGGVVFNIVYWGFAFLRMSMSGLTAQAYGKGDRAAMARGLQQGLMMALAGAILLLLFQVPVERFSFWVLEGSDQVKEMAGHYFYVRIWAAPAAISLMVFYGWFLGMQNALYPMVIAVTVNLVNILGSFIFVRYLHLKVTGVALGSVLGQYVGLVLAIILFLFKYPWVRRFFTLKLKVVGNGFSRLLNVGGDIFVRTLCIILVFTFFTSRSAGMGDDTLAANSALLQFLFLFSYFLDGFAYAAEAMVGRWFGSNDKRMLNRAVKYLLVWGASFGVLFSLAYAIAGNRLLLFFTEEHLVVKTGTQYLGWIIAMPLVSFASYIWDGVYIGATASKVMRNTMLISAGCFFFLPFFMLSPFLQNHALWMSMLLFMFSRGVLLSWLYHRI